MKNSNQSFDPWALNFIGGAEFTERKPTSSGSRGVREFLGVNRIAVAREVHSVLARAKVLGSMANLLAEQGERARVQGRLPSGVQPADFASYRLQYLLYLAHKTGAGAAKRRLRKAAGHSGRYEYPMLPVKGSHLQLVPKAKPVLTFETLHAYMARGGRVKVYSAPVVVLVGVEKKPVTRARLVSVRGLLVDRRAA